MYKKQRKKSFEMKQMGQAFHPSMLPIDSELIKTDIFLDELIDASTSLEVYKEKIANWIGRGFCQHYSKKRH